MKVQDFDSILRHAKRLKHDGYNAEGAFAPLRDCRDHSFFGDYLINRAIYHSFGTLKTVGEFPEKGKLHNALGRPQSG